MSKLNGIMKERKITSQALADLTGISKRVLDSYRMGARSMSFENGMKIADALKVDPHELIEKES